jgi:predicted kinase
MTPPRRATLHLISGLPCAGKTTYAEQLKDQRNAALFSLDRWLITSFGRYSLDAVGYLEHARRLYACRELIWDVTVELLRRQADVILDDGFFLRNDRQQHIARAHALGAGAVLHFIDTPLDTLRARLAARNRSPGAYHFDIAPEAVETFGAFFEPPSNDEGAELIVVRAPPSICRSCTSANSSTATAGRRSSARPARSRSFFARCSACAPFHAAGRRRWSSGCSAG